ncbi:MAG: endolytic transglycosylase MltG [Magnetospirillum sp.]|nr:endolytic transglycosylase MltG [Magnetospirillum sp.]
MKRLLKLTAVLALVAALAVAGLAWEGHRRFTAPGPLAQPATVIVPKGTGPDSIARRLAEAGVIADPLVFRVGVRLRKATLRAGEYAFPAAASAEAVMAQMVEGRTVVHKLTIAEGLTVRQILAEVQAADFLAGTVSRIPTEGALLPETWHLSRDDSRDELIGRMERSMAQLLDTLWATRAPGLALKDKYEALVLASIVERETGIATERPHVAGVFHNRLRIGMRLQSDPTVIYGLSGRLGVLDRPLSRADLQTEHAWNTYVIAGLPPTPIANPGRASLEATLHPVATDDLYFVADGSGGHAFSPSLERHNAAVGNWRKVEKTRKKR